jgi:hypothetical protein
MKRVTASLINQGLPEVSAECPCSKPNMLPQALLIDAILAMIGRLWMTKLTSFFWILARFLAWPSNPNPVISVAPWALYLCYQKVFQQTILHGKYKVSFMRDKRRWGRYYLIIFFKVGPGSLHMCDVLFWWQSVPPLDRYKCQYNASKQSF